MLCQYTYSLYSTMVLFLVALEVDIEIISNTVFTYKNITLLKSCLYNHLTVPKMYLILIKTYNT